MTNSANNSCENKGQTSEYMVTSGKFLKCKTFRKQLMLFVGEIPALQGPLPKETGKVVIPISPDISLPWLEDYIHDGWSARMFLHQMLRTSQPAWNCWDTERLLSALTLRTLRVKIASGSSLSDVLMKESPPLSSGLYLTRQMISGLIHRAVKRKRCLQRVLLRTHAGWQQRTIIVSSPKSNDYVFSVRKNARDCRDSPSTGLLDFLQTAVESCSETR